MTKEEYLDFCGSIAGATYDQPFNEDFQSTALRHWDTKKWFGLLMLHNDRWIVSSKLLRVRSSISSVGTSLSRYNVIQWTLFM